MTKNEMMKSITMKGLTAKNVMMLLALAGSNYCQAQNAVKGGNAAQQQTTIVVSNPTSASRTELVELSMSDISSLVPPPRRERLTS